MRYVVFCVAVSCWAAVSPTPAYTQSLGELAKAEEARRATIKQPAKIYTEKDLVVPRDVPATTLVPPLPAATPAPVAVAAITTAVVKDESYWKDRMRVLRAQLDADQTFEQEAAARELRLNDLAHRSTADSRDAIGRFTTDRRQLAEATRAWQDAVAETGRLRAAILNDKRAIMSLEEEARRAGVLPGWLLP
jgi:hypothetical protein